MLSIRLNKNASYQTQIAALFLENLPNRIQAAQAAALEKTKQELRRKLPELGKPAKYIVVDIAGFGPIGATLRLTPQKSNRSSRSGYDRGMAAYVFIKGRRGGRIVVPKSAQIMKLRKQSVAEGYPPFLKQFKLGALKSNKDQIRNMARETLLSNIHLGLRTQGFGTKSGTPSRIRTDKPFTAR